MPVALKIVLSFLKSLRHPFTEMNISLETGEILHEHDYVPKADRVPGSRDSHSEN